MGLSSIGIYCIYIGKYCSSPSLSAVVFVFSLTFVLGLSIIHRDQRQIIHFRFLLQCLLSMMVKPVKLHTLLRIYKLPYLSCLLLSILIYSSCKT